MFGTGLGVYLPLALYIVICVGSLLAFIRPAVAVYILAVILPLQSARNKIAEMPMGGRLIYVLLFCAIIGVIINSKSLVPPKPLRIRIAALLIISYISIWVGYTLRSDVPFPLFTAALADGRTPFSYFVSFMQLPVLYLLVNATIKDKRQVYILLLAMMFAFLWNVKNFHGNVSGRETVTYTNNLRNSMGADFGGSNGRAAYSTQATLFLLGVFSAIKSLRIRIVAAVLICLGTYAVIFSYSRGAYLALALGLLYLMIFRMRWLIPVVFVGMPFMGLLLPQAVIQRVTMTYHSDSAEVDESSAQRLAIWKHALNTSLVDPLLGVGFDTYRYYRANEELQDTHNMYVKAYVETGVAGLVCLLSLFGGAFFLAHRLFRQSTDPFDRALGLGFAAFMVAVISTNIFGDRWTYPDLSANTWVLMALVVQATLAHQNLVAAPGAVEQTSPTSVLAPS